MEDTLQPKGLISFGTRGKLLGKAFVAFGMLLMVGIVILTVLVVWAAPSSTLTPGQELDVILMLILLILFGLNALRAGRSLIKKGAISKRACIAGGLLLIAAISIGNSAF